MRRSLKRVVTGHDGDGKAVVVLHGEPAQVITIPNAPGLYFNEMWNTGQTPALIDNSGDPTIGAGRLPPPAGGSIIRVLQIPPERDSPLPATEEERREHFRHVGSADASTGSSESSAGRRPAPHPMMHRTQTIDYGIVIEGTLTLILDDSELELHAGDVVVQRGTNHAWSNRSDSPVLIAFVLLDAQYDPRVKAAIERWDSGQ